MKRRALGVIVIAFAAIFSGACASHTVIPNEDRVRLERNLPGKTFYLRHAMYVGPFWGEEDKRFLSDVVPGEIPWVVNPAGLPMDPGEPTAIVPAGTRARVAKLELPTGFTIATRNPFSPRYNPWLLVEVEGLPRNPVQVIVLRSDLRSGEELMAEIDRYLSQDDLEPMLAKLSTGLRKAVNEKRLVEGMTADLVAMAWGWPERRTITPAPEGRREEWVWPSEQRKALLVGGKLVSWEGSGVFFDEEL